MGGSFWPLGRLLGHFWSFSGASVFEVAFWWGFGSISFDFGSILARVGEDFGRIFRRFLGFSSKAPIIKIRAPTQCFVRVGLFKSNKKSRKSTRKIFANLEWEKHCSKIAQKMALGEFGASIWKGLGGSWALWGRSWGLFGHSWVALGALLEGSCAFLGPR